MVKCCIVVEPSVIRKGSKIERMEWERVLPYEVEGWELFCIFTEQSKNKKTLLWQISKSI